MPTLKTATTSSRPTTAVQQSQGQSQGKIGQPTLDRSVAEVRAPAVTAGQAENRMQTSVYTTDVGVTQLLYEGDRMWAKVTVTLLTVGPVAVGHQSTLVPVLSGKGQRLQTGVPAVFSIAKGTKLYVAASAISTLNLQVEAFPWLETITGLVSALAGVVQSPVQSVMAAYKIATGKIGK